MIELLSVVLAVMAQEEKPYPVEKTWEGRGSQIVEPGIALVCARFPFGELWKRHAGKDAAAPEVDFKKHFVVAVFPEGKWHGITSSVTADAERVTLTLVLGNKKAVDYVAHHAILVLPRTTRPIRVRTRVHSCTRIDEKDDKIVGELATTCSQPGECVDCRKGAGTKACPACGKGECAGLELMCRECARQAGVCPVCGRVPTEPCLKPDACHTRHRDEAGSCSRCKAAIANGCDALCAKCAGVTACRLCGRRK